MIPLLCMAFIPDLSSSSSMTKHILSERDYFNRGRSELKDFICPSCKEKGGLFMGFHSYGCYNCFNYFGEEEIIEANEV